MIILYLRNSCVFLFVENIRFKVKSHKEVDFTRFMRNVEKHEYEYENSKKKKKYKQVT